MSEDEKKFEQFRQLLESWDPDGTLYPALAVMTLEDFLVIERAAREGE